MNYQNYVWDLGGTLLDNYESSAHAFVTVLLRYGRVALHDEVYAALKISTGNAIDRFAADIPDFLREYRALEAVALEKPILFVGAREALETVVKSGGSNFMISHRDDQVNQILGVAGIRQFFTEVVTADNGFPRKPAPDSLLYLLGKYQLQPEETVMIGDRALDVEAGRAAGVGTIFFDPTKTTLRELV